MLHINEFGALGAIIGAVAEGLTEAVSQLADGGITDLRAIGEATLEGAILAAVVPSAAAGSIGRLLKTAKNLKTKPKAGDVTKNAGNYIPAPKKVEGIPGLKPAKPKTSVQGGGGLRKRWKDKKGNIYEWDSQHGAVEKYNKRGKHQGEFDPATGDQTKPADKTRTVEP